MASVGGRRLPATGGRLVRLDELGGQVDLQRCLGSHAEVDEPCGELVAPRFQILPLVRVDVHGHPGVVARVECERRRPAADEAEVDGSECVARPGDQPDRPEGVAIGPPTLIPRVDDVDGELVEVGLGARDLGPAQHEAQTALGATPPERLRLGVHLHAGGRAVSRRRHLRDAPPARSITDRAAEHDRVLQAGQHPPPRRGSAGRQRFGRHVEIERSEQGCELCPVLAQGCALDGDAPDLRLVNGCVHR
ncbi:hypothetical protein [Agromyces sp. CCNWLW203]|uniref:hypothetical protein n=1 Tax=Agromyces sp. CCNWLW203 TaxID=3112842 RepID=UPI002F964974